MYSETSGSKGEEENVSALTCKKVEKMEKENQFVCSDKKQERREKKLSSGHIGHTKIDQCKKNVSSHSSLM